MQSFAENISVMKFVTKNWYFSFKEKSQALLKETKLGTKKLFDDNSFGIFIDEEIANFISL